MRLNFDPDKHDAKVRARDVERTKGKVRQIYDLWKAKLCGQRLPKKELISRLYQLREEVMAAVKTVDELKPWAEHTLTMFEDMVTRAMTKEITDHNTITQYIPELGPKPDTGIVFLGKPPKAREFTFRNHAEFLQLPFVAEHKGKEHFIGFCVEDSGVSLMVTAYYSDGEVVNVGRVANRIGLEGFPTADELAEELDKADKAKDN